MKYGPALLPGATRGALFSLFQKFYSSAQDFLWTTFHPSFPLREIEWHSSQVKFKLPSSCSMLTVELLNRLGYFCFPPSVFPSPAPHWRFTRLQFAGRLPVHVCASIFFYLLWRAEFVPLEDPRQQCNSNLPCQCWFVDSVTLPRLRWILTPQWAQNAKRPCLIWCVSRHVKLHFDAFIQVFSTSL